MIPKPKRITNRKLLDEIKTRPCCVCGSTKDVDPSHIKTKGSGGPDSEVNCQPMCRHCHIEWGQVGQTRFRQRHPHFEQMLYNLGWRELNGKLWHPDLGEV